MLGTLFAGFLITTSFGVTVSGASVLGWVLFVVALIACMAFCATINVSIEFVAYRRLRRAPKLAPLITAVGMSFVLLFFGLRWNGSGAEEQLGERAPAGACGLRRRPDRAQAVRRHRHDGPAAAADELDRDQDPDRQGDAGSGPGPGRGPAHGHQRQPDHLVHVRPGWCAGRRGRADVPAGHRDDPVRPRLPASA